MPSRVIRGEIVSSRSLSRVPWQADWLFHKLLHATDDFGRMDGRLEIVRSLCFPNRLDVSMGEIDRWLDELTRCDPDGTGPVQRYEVDGWPYIQLVNWEKHRGKANRAETSKFPAPRESPRKSAENSGDPRSGSGVSGSGVRGLVKDRARAPQPAAAPSAKRGPKPSSRAIKAFCEEYKTARAVTPPVPSKDQRELGEAYADLGEARFRAAVQEFLRLDDAWIKDRSYSSRAFLQALTKCVVRVQDAERLAAGAPEADPAEGLDPKITSLFGGSCRG
jgi:hypothetical protein